MSMELMRSIWVVGTLLVTAHRADAQAPDVEPEDDTYGYQVVIVDTIGVALFGGGLAYALTAEGDDKAVSIGPIIGGMLTYTFGSAGIHHMHGKKDAMTGVPLLKILTPTVGMFMGAKLAQQIDGSDRSQWIGATIGAATGVVAATTIDAVWIARVPKPVVLPAEGGATVAVVGRF